MIGADLISGVLQSAVVLMTPLILAGAAEILVEKSGILNVSIEGSMLMGAFGAFMVTFYVGNLGWATLAAAFVGVAFTLLFAFLTISLALDQLVTGIALNLLSVGLTSYLYRASFGWYVSPVPPHTDLILTSLPIPFLSQIPVIGSALFNQFPLTYLGLVLVPVVWWILTKTQFGLKVKAMGEDPQVSDYLGVNVNRTRYGLLAVEGAITGLAGAMLSIGYYNMFLTNMTLGRGYIAVALVVVSRWNPILLLGAVFAFSLVNAVQLAIQATGSTFFPPELSLMLPYLFTIIILLIAGRRLRGPAALTKVFKRLR